MRVVLDGRVEIEDAFRQCFDRVAGGGLSLRSRVIDFENLVQCRGKLLKEQGSQIREERH